jgi:alkyl sulfatase BDS1-like metallo-beta-lactamase superfamily hydrolase
MFSNKFLMAALACAIAVVVFAPAIQLATAAGGAAGEIQKVDPSVHFHPKGKPPSEHTLKVLQKARDTMPFEDTQDFDEARKGFIAPLNSMIVEADAGHIAWDVERYEFLRADEDWPSVHPSTQRIGHLNQITGLYKVTDGVYQVRGLDLANITFVRGKEGWIVFDPLTALETARAGLELINQEVEDLPVTAVIYSHSHGDHFGGVRGVVDPERLAAGKVEIIAPRHFMLEAVSENVYAGNAMNRRLFYQYGVLLPASPFGHAGQGLMQNVAAGNFGLLPPTYVVEDYIEEREVDGVKMIFQNTPGTEAPSEMNTYIPEKKALWMAENVTGTIHNIYTLRGAQVRDALAWSKFISRALYLFGQEAEVMFASHHWPRWGNDRVQEVLKGQRDAYAHLNNQVLHYANQGVTINQIHNVYRVPQSLEDSWYARGYHGSPEHNSRGVLNRFLGYWDANPTTLIPLSPQDSAPLYVEMMGGSEAIIRRGQELHEEGKYFYAQEILDKLVWAEPENMEARHLLADVWEQIGFQQENPGLRNSFLAGAFELRSGIPEGASPDSSGPDMIGAMSTELFLDFIGIRMDSKKAEELGLGPYTMNLITPDNGEKFAIELSNATFTNVEGFLHDDPDLSITIDRKDLEQIMMGRKSFAMSIEDGTAEAQGNADILGEIAQTLVNFEIGFEVLPGTAGPAREADLNPYEFESDDMWVSGE